MKHYNKIQYWGTRLDPNTNMGRRDSSKYVQLVTPHIPNNSKILDYGPGVGRMLELYNNQESLSFYDITPIYKDRLSDECKSKGIKIKDYIIDDSGQIKTPFKNDEFDIVCAFAVLLHSPPTEIKDLLKELARIGKKVVVTTWWSNNLEKSFGNCWTWNYKELLSQNDLNLIHWDETSIPTQVFFTYNK